MSEGYIRKVINGSINLLGEKFKHSGLKIFNGSQVILIPSNTGCGFDVYYKTKFICYIQTVDSNLKGESND